MRGWTRTAAVLAATVCFGAIGIDEASTVSAASGVPTGLRVAGRDRFDTAVALAKRTYPRGAKSVYVASGTSFADAMAAGSAAARQGGPLLLVTKTAVPASVRKEIARLSPAQIVVLGGTSVISDAVANDLRAIKRSTVVRRAGRDRYDTAAAISAGAFATRPGTAYVVTGGSFADGLTASAAANGDGPVLLVTPSAVPPATAAELARLRPGRVVVIGGTASVGEAVMRRLGVVSGATVSRISGRDRYATAAAVAATTPQRRTLYVANGSGFADALPAGAAAAHDDANLLLVPPRSVVGPGIKVAAATPGATVIAVGGPAAVAESQLRTLAMVPGARVPAPSRRVPEVLAAARAQLGKPYQWAAAGPGAFDCSGLTSFAWSVAGARLSHFSGAQHDELPKVPMASRQPGDLIFFGDPIHHVALYVGGDQMIEASQTGTFVRTASIWRSDIVGVGRPG